MFDPFSKENQDIAVRESAKDQWKLAVKYDKEDDEEDEDAYASESDDDEKDELDVMQEIRIGTRRSARVQHQRTTNNQQQRITGFFIRSDQIQMEDDDIE